MRGIHICQYCPRTSDHDTLTTEHGLRLLSDAYILAAEHNGQRLRLDNGEIRVPAQSGTMFAAPTLIWHYIDKYNYRPPGSFIAAVLAYNDAWMSDSSSGWIPADAETITY